MRDTVLTPAEAQVLRLFVLPKEASEKAESWDTEGLRSPDHYRRMAAFVEQRRAALLGEVRVGRGACEVRYVWGECVALNITSTRAWMWRHVPDYQVGLLEQYDPSQLAAAIRDIRTGRHAGAVPAAEVVYWACTANHRRDLLYVVV